MKIAIPTKDGATLSRHFGGADKFVIVTVEDGKETARETRERPAHRDFAAGEENPQTDERGRHGFGPQATERHKAIHDVIKDCDVIIASRMGLGAHEDMRSFGMKVIVTEVEDIDSAVSLYASGQLKHREDRVC